MEDIVPGVGTAFRLPGTCDANDFRDERESICDVDLLDLAAAISRRVEVTRTVLTTAVPSPT